MGRFLAFGSIFSYGFGFLFDFWLLGRFLVEIRLLGGFLALGSIFGRVLAFGLNFAYWVDFL